MKLKNIIKGQIYGLIIILLASALEEKNQEKGRNKCK